MLRHSNGDSAVKTSFSFSRNTDLEPPRLPEFPSVAKNFENRSIVLAFLLQDEGEGKMREGIKAMSRLYKSESSKLAKIVEVATVSISSEEANRSQARNALLLLGSKADPFERRGVSSIFKEFFANRIRVHGNSFDAVSKARKS